MNDIESALALWDALDDDAEIFFPVVVSNSKKAFYLEKPAGKDTMTIRAFISQSEAQSYVIQRQNSSVSLATSTVGHLLSSLERNLSRNIDKKVNCVLSTLDMEGNFHAIETIWSNSGQNL